jgi:hypothetical protein
VADGRPDGTGYFVGYGSKSKACVGYLGTAGFRQGPLPAAEHIPFGGVTSGNEARVFCTQREHLPTEHPQDRPGGRAPRGSVSTWDVFVLGRGGKIYHADLQNRSLHVAVDEPRLRSAALVAGPVDPVHGTPYHLAVRTDDAVTVHDERGQVRQRYPIPEALRRRDITFAETTTGEAVMFTHTPFDELAAHIDYHICWVSPTGRCREASVRLAGHGRPETVPLTYGVMLPAPLVLAGYVGALRPLHLLNDGLETSYAGALGQAVTEFWPSLALALLLAAGFAVLCYRRQVRYGASTPERLLWPLFVLALGLPGWVAYRFALSWPVLEACSDCGAAVPRDRAECACCESEFPRPALIGTEVLA